MKENAGYLDYSSRDDVFSGGVKSILVRTPKGDFRVWTKRVGNNPTIKLLLLHGGPGASALRGSSTPHSISVGPLAPRPRTA